MPLSSSGTVLGRYGIWLFLVRNTPTNHCCRRIRGSLCRDGFMTSNSHGDGWYFLCSNYSQKMSESEDPKWHPGALTRSVGNNTSHKEDIAYAALLVRQHVA